jgi:hypothetical protein
LLQEAGLCGYLTSAADALRPPSISLSRVGLPAVQRGAPELSCCGERVRGHAANELWRAVLSQLEEVLVRPHIRRLPPHIDRHVPDEIDTLAVRILLNAVTPLQVSLVELSDAPCVCGGAQRQKDENKYLVASATKQRKVRMLGWECLGVSIVA